MSDDLTFGEVWRDTIDNERVMFIAPFGRIDDEEGGSWVLLLGNPGGTRKVGEITSRSNLPGRHWRLVDDAE